MKKSDLKNGMVVELRNGKRFLIVNDLGIGKDSCITLDGLFGYDENLYDVLRNGKRFLIVDDLGIGEDSYINLDGLFGYDENLYDVRGDSTYDITKIYKTVGTTFKTLFDNERLSLIWEREEKSKLSKEDKKIIKKGLKKIQEECKRHKFCYGCMFDDNGHCLLDEIETLEVDKLFED